MPVVSPSLIIGLHRIFADHQGELARAILRRELAKNLVQKLPPR